MYTPKQLIIDLYHQTFREWLVIGLVLLAGVLFAYPFVAYLLSLAPQ